MPAVRLDLDSHRVWISGHPIELRPQEQQLLSLLHRTPNQLMTTTTIVAMLYGNIPIDAGRVRLRRLVADIRDRVGSEFARRLRTIPKVGLVLVDESSAAHNEFHSGDLV